MKSNLKNLSFTRPKVKIYTGVYQTHTVLLYNKAFEYIVTNIIISNFIQYHSITKQLLVLPYFKGIYNPYTPEGIPKPNFEPTM